MRLILANFNNVLGLNGYLNFVVGKPLLIYGENIAGKSNIVNILRYCLIPKIKEKKGYAEEKRLRRDEILLRKNSSGSIEIYFEQNNKFYKLYYSFSRKGKNVGQLERIYESETMKLPNEDEKRVQILRGLDWKDLEASTYKSLKEKLVEIGIYPEILDILISASNVRNFSEAINGSVVRVPEIVAAKISNLHNNAGRYIENLKKLFGVITLEKEEFERRIKQLRTEFDGVSKNLPEMKVDEIFIIGAISKNLDSVRNTLSKELELMPEKTGEMKETLMLLSSEKYDLWTNAIDKIVAILSRKEELRSLLGKTSNFETLQLSLTEWKTIFEQLPPDSNPENIITFTVPKYEKFDFSIFSNPERIKSLFLLTETAKECIQRANGICDKYRVPSKFSHINEMIKSYDELLKVLRNPSEPVGDPALITRRDEKTLVSIPLDVALAKVDYLRGIEPTPLVHRPEKLNASKFKKEVLRVQAEVSACRTELREAKDNLSEAKKLLRKTKQIRESLSSEIEILKKKNEKTKKELDGLAEEWKNAYHHLCEVFKLKHVEIDLSRPDSADHSYEITSEKYKETQKIFESELIQRLRNYPEIIEKYKGQKPMDIVKKVTKEFEERITRLTTLQTEYKKVNDWILSNDDQIKTLENRNKTREIITTCLIISSEILSRIHKKADIKRTIEDLADKIEVNVKDVYSKIFPEDKSFSFEHLEEGQFLSTINNEPITHPSGSQRVAISIAIMLSLGETFRLPILLDEAFDRIDVNRLRFFSEYITGIALSSETTQICLAGFTTFNIERNPEVLRFVNNWKIYLVKRTSVSEKNIQLLEGLSSD